MCALLHKSRHRRETVEAVPKAVLKSRTWTATRLDGSSVKDVFFIGSRVKCRDAEDILLSGEGRGGKLWRSGTVRSLHPFKIKASGFDFACKWQYVFNDIEGRSDVPDLADGWIPLFDVNQARYYYCETRTDQVTWDFPTAATASALEQPAPQIAAGGTRQHGASLGDRPNGDVSAQHSIDLDDGNAELQSSILNSFTALTRRDPLELAQEQVVVAASEAVPYTAISLLTLDGETKEIKIPAISTTAELYAIVADVQKLGPNTFHLCNGKQRILPEDAVLDYDLISGTTITLVRLSPTISTTITAEVMEYQ